MLKKTIIALSLVLFVFAATVVVADAATGGVKKLQDNLTGFGSDTGLGDDANLSEKIASIVNIVLGFVGLLSTIIIIYAGFRWMTASGNEEQIKEAKGNIRNAVIGIVVVLLSFTIINFVVSRVSEETGAGGGGGGGGGAVVPSENEGVCVYDGGGLSFRRVRCKAEEDDCIAEANGAPLRWSPGLCSATGSCTIGTECRQTTHQACAERGDDFLDWEFERNRICVSPGSESQP